MSRENETIIWEGSPSNWINLLFYISCVFLILLYGFGILLGLWKFLDTKFQKIKITNQRIVLRSGIFSFTTNYLEFYRVKDIKHSQPLLLRFFQLSNIILFTSDNSNPVFIIKGVEKGEELAEQIRGLVELNRYSKGVREIDFN